MAHGLRSASPDQVLAVARPETLAISGGLVVLITVETGAGVVMLVGGPRQGEEALVLTGLSHVADEDGCEYRIVGDVAILETLATDQEAPFRDMR